MADQASVVPALGPSCSPSWTALLTPRFVLLAVGVGLLWGVGFGWHDGELGRPANWLYAAAAAGAVLLLSVMKERPRPVPGVTVVAIFALTGTLAVPDGPARAGLIAAIVLAWAAATEGLGRRASRCAQRASRSAPTAARRPPPRG